MYRRVRDVCDAAGFDLCRPLRVEWYNDTVEDRLRLPDFARPESLALVVGNTRALWPRLLEAARADRDLREDANPVERYTELSIEAAAGLPGVATQVRWAHSVGDEMVAIQRLAQISGLAYLSPANLSVHPEYGPWIGLRAAIVADVSGPAGAPAPMPRPCEECERACMPALRALQERPVGSVAALDWVAVRDACPLGRRHRYGDEQIEYHYVKRPEVWRDAVNGVRGRPA